MADRRLPWWRRWEGLLEWELAALDAAGFTHRLDHALLESEAIVRIFVDVELDGRKFEAVATFPDLYPYFRFEVAAPGLDLAHHQNPFDKNLCLVNRSTENWSVDDSLAAFLRDRVPMTVSAGSTDEIAEVNDLEEHQPEPLAEFYPYVEGASVAYDGNWDIVGARGTLRIGLVTGRPPLQGFVTDVYDQGGTSLAVLSEPARSRFAKAITGKWVALAEPVRSTNPKDFWEAAVAADARLAKPFWQEHPGLHKRKLAVIGILFPDEVRWRASGQSWVFLVIVAGAKAQAAMSRGAPADVGMFLVRGVRAGRDDLQERIPGLAHLREATVVVVGNGGIGGPTVMELARAGTGTIRAVDFDIADAGPSVRWPLGMPAVGVQKGEALQAHLAAHYPHVRVEPTTWRIGAPREPGVERPTDQEILDLVLDGADLVVDASAEPGVQHFLSETCRDAGVPYLACWTVAGATGAVAVRITPDTGCWVCFIDGCEDGTYVMPVADPAGDVAPVGCAARTFTGAGFDVAAAAMHGVRMAVATLSPGGDGDYPPSKADIVAVTYRSPDDASAVGEAWAWRLERRAGCPNCATP